MLYSLKYMFLSTVIIAAIDAHLKDKAKQIYIGTALRSRILANDTTYKTIAEQEFNCMTADDEFKWGAIEATRGQSNYTKADTLVSFAQQNGMKIRGHTLIWHNRLPDWVPALETNKTELHSAMRKHITDVVTHFRGKVFVWDVLNELLFGNGTFQNTIWYRSFGTTFIAEALQLAHEADPNAKLYINDFGVEAINKKSDALFKLVQGLKAQGVPIHGVGLQTHIAVGQLPSDMQANMKRFSDIGIDVAITEMNVRIPLPSDPQKLQQQARDYSQAVTYCLSVQRCVGVTVWGFDDRYSVTPDYFKGYGDANLWDKEFRPKPAVVAVENALK